MRSIVLAGILSTWIGCTTFSPGLMDADRTADAFFADWQRTQAREAYDIFSLELTKKISFGHFEQFLENLGNQWGRLEEYETVSMPFHIRAGESDFIPENIPTEDVKRYTYELKFDHAAIDCALTLIRENDTYQIAWFSLWGSDNYMTPEMRDKIDELWDSSESIQRTRSF